MKDQASLNLKIVDIPISKNALEGHLMLNATSDGLKVYNHAGEEQSLGGGGTGSMRPFINRIFANNTYGTVAYLDATNSMVFSGTYIQPITTIDLWITPASNYNGIVYLKVTGSGVANVGGLGIAAVPVSESFKARTGAGIILHSTLKLSTPLTGSDITISRDTTAELAATDGLVDDGELITAMVVDWRCS